MNERVESRFRRYPMVVVAVLAAFVIIGQENGCGGDDNEDQPTPTPSEELVKRARELLDQLETSTPPIDPGVASSTAAALKKLLDTIPPRPETTTASGFPLNTPTSTLAGLNDVLAGVKTSTPPKPPLPDTDKELLEELKRLLRRILLGLDPFNPLPTPVPPK